MDQNVSLLIAFTAGLLSFVAPCALPLVPSYLSYITGLTFKDLTKGGVRMTTVKHSLLFIAGFSTVFILLGAAASSLGSVLKEYQSILRWIGGIIIIFFGFYITGLFNLKFLNKNIKFEFAKRPSGLFGSFLIGSGFSIGWTACVGPILGTILFYAGSTETVSQGIELLAAYSLGLGIPFFIASLAVNSFLAASKRIRKHMRLIEIISGVFLIIVGILILTNYFAILSSSLQKLGVGWMR